MLTEIQFLAILGSISQREKSPVVCVDATQGEVFVPRDCIDKDGCIRLHMGPESIRNFRVANDVVYFHASFNHKVFSISFPLASVVEIIEE